MNFYETMQFKGYSKDKEENNILSFKKEAEQSSIIIVFDMTKKELEGFLIPSQVIKVELDLKILNEDLNVMLDDLNYFQKLSKYTIIN